MGGDDYHASWIARALPIGPLPGRCFFACPIIKGASAISHVNRTVRIGVVDIVGVAEALKDVRRVAEACRDQDQEIFVAEHEAMYQDYLADKADDASKQRNGEYRKAEQAAPF